MLGVGPHTVPRVGRSYERFPDGFEVHLLQPPLIQKPKTIFMRAITDDGPPMLQQSKPFNWSQERR